MSVVRLSLMVPLLVCLGCGSSGSAGVEVTGKVTLAKKPLEKGEIFFFPADGKPPIKLDISNGQFSGKVPVGKHKIQFSSTREMKNPKYDKNSPGSEPTALINVIPPKWAADCQETREVTASGPNSFDFKLD